MGKRTALYDTHVSAGAKMVDFGGWDMPLHYGSQLDEHHLVRRAAGMFDVSHMTIVDLKGGRTREFLRHLAANNVDKLKRPGKALYTCMLNERGGVIDDLIIYFVADDWFRLVVNAATRDKDLAWIETHAAPYAVAVGERRDLAMIAVQGPNARDAVHAALPDIAETAAALAAPFTFAVVGEMFIARTGYTGEDGYELMVPAALAAEVWQRLAVAGVKPAGLGARDTLRLEAGMNLYGADMDETTTPLESGLAWTVGWEPPSRDFIGRAVLDAQRTSSDVARFIGLVMTERGVLRNHQKVMRAGEVIGEITSGSFSPTLGRAIALARVHGDPGASCQVEMRGKAVEVKVVKPPFVRNGKACVGI
ncbi:MAG: glycine cleavage system aminomethyltransferase GcvT [Gammaproteobacteria bacterium]|jgi:aminomethyltransferase